MSLIPWRSRRDERASGGRPGLLADFRREFDELFHRFLGEELVGDRKVAVDALAPQLDLDEHDDHFTVRVELAGVEPKDVEVDVAGKTLTISGQKSVEQEGARGERWWSERRFGRFQRVLDLPCAVQADGVTARFRNGVLTVEVPKDAAAQPKRIQVHAQN